MTATLWPVRVCGRSGLTQPSAKALSMIETSIDLMVTASPSIPTVQEPSHGAGQTRPVNSAKLLVFWRRISASCHCPL